MNGRKIIVINESAQDNDIVQEVISIITSMCARIYGQRRKSRKTEALILELKKEQKERDKEAS
jgi:predicted site-specific integrase-resolvase